jgi:hypothetical protein
VTGVPKEAVNRLENCKVTAIAGLNPAYPPLITRTNGQSKRPHPRRPKSGAKTYRKAESAQLFASSAAGAL